MRNSLRAGPPTDLAARYGTGRRRPWVVALVVVVAAAALTWLGWAMLLTVRPQVTSDLRSFDVQSPYFVEAEVVVVRRNADVEATCLLRAQAADHAVVGELSFTVDDRQPATATLTRRFRTERLATAVSMPGCSAPGQPRRQ